MRKYYLLLISQARGPLLGEYCTRSFWYRPSEARSVQERLRAIFSQYGPELVRVNKKFIKWLCLRLYYCITVLCTFTFSIFPLYQPGINIARNARGHYGKIWHRILANRSPRYIFTSSSHIIRWNNEYMEMIKFAKKNANKNFIKLLLSLRKTS